MTILHTAEYARTHDPVEIAYDLAIRAFMRESLQIEGIKRMPTKKEKEATKTFLRQGSVTLENLIAMQKVYAPHRPLRDLPTLNVRVGRHIPPQGGPGIVTLLEEIIDAVNRVGDPWRTHCDFETLHPFMDGNGRTGRTLWAWSMKRNGLDPFALPFLHRFYYQTLAALPGRMGDGR